MTLTTTTETETAAPKPTVRTELGNRQESGEVPSQNNPSFDPIEYLKSRPWYREPTEPKTNYERWTRYQQLPPKEKKNARKRLQWRILREQGAASIALMNKQAPAYRPTGLESSKNQRRGKG